MAQTDKPEPQPDGIVETALFVEDLARACEFYEQALGLKKVKASDTGCVFAWVSSDISFLSFARQRERRTKPQAVISCLRALCRSITVEARDISHSAFPQMRWTRGAPDSQRKALKS
jgi:predicted enzyme related to lactoylglutathione lyase